MRYSLWRMSVFFLILTFIYSNAEAGRKTRDLVFEDEPAPQASLPREKAWAEILATTKRASDPSMPVQIDLFDVRRGESLGVLAGMCAGSR